MSNKTFFTTERGITATSATTIANYANEKRVAIEAILDKVSFYQEERDLVGTDSLPKIVKAGYSDKKTESLFNYAMKSAQLCALNAWLREAVKTKEVLLKEAASAIPELEELEMPASPNYEARLSRGEYCEKFNYPMPIKPICKEVSEQDIINAFTPKELAEYLASNSKAAVFGKLAHSEGSLNEAREELHTIIEEPYSVSDTMIKHFIPTVSADLVDSVFTKFQAQQRAYNAEYNSWKNRIKKTLLAEEQKNEMEYKEAYAKYKKELADLDNLREQEFQARKNVYEQEYLAYQTLLDEYLSKKAEQDQRILIYRKEQQEVVSALKILIPDSLQEIFTELDNELRTR